MADPVLEALQGGGASSATLDAEAKTLTIPGAGGGADEPNDITAKHTLTTSSGKQLSYALGAFYLCLAKPDQSYVAYRKECRELGVEACKVTERKDVLEYFGVAAEGGGGAGAGDSAAAAPTEAAAAASSDKKDDADESKKRSSRDKDRKRSGSSGKDKRKESHEERKARKLREKEEAERRQKEKDEAAARLRAQKKERAKTGMTNEELMEGLDVVVDKRDEDELGGGGGAAVSGGKTTGLDDHGAASGTAAGAPTPTVLSEEEKEEEEERKQHALVIQSLSSTGFEVGGMADAIESDRKAVEAITAMEIPVGNSASVLRCGAGVGDARRDFSRVLELYTESLKAEERAKRAAAAAAAGGSGSGSGSGGGPPGSDRKRSSSGGDRWGPKDPKRAKGGDAASSSKSGGRNAPPRPKATGPPIIIVPNAMTSPITLVNATDFFRNATFVPRAVALKKAGGNASLAQLRKETVMVRHKVAPRLGGREIDFEIVDNPTTRLRNPADWDRVVAVIAQGAEWQFKGWRHAKPVDLFGRCFGFYFGIEGAPIPKELLGWNVKVGNFNRDKRGLDSVTFASFWNGLSEWMHVNKPEYLKLESEGA